MKEWYSAVELAQFRLPGVPETNRGILFCASRGKWRSRKRSFGKGREYHINSLPEDARFALLFRERDIERMAAPTPSAPAEPTRPHDADAPRHAVQRLILRAFDQYQHTEGLPRLQAAREFCLLYAVRSVPGLPEWAYGPSFSERTLRRWLKERKDGTLNDERRRGPDRDTGFLFRAEDGAVAEYIGALLVKQPHLTGGHIRDLVRARFGNSLRIDGGTVKLPAIRSFVRFIARWKVLNADILEKLTDPDRYKNRRMLALGRADAGIERLNQLWEIDASPTDVLCRDGRRTLYAMIDVYSRRTLFHVSPTPTTEAALALVRRAILEWGVPEAIKTDNGSDFISKRFKAALAALDIDQPVCTPFSPEQKPHVERVIKTMQHGLMPLLPGYVGHSVADRKQIEARKAFAQRLGESADKAYAVELSQEGLQDAIDRWAADKYAHSRHGGIGTTPFLKAAEWTEPVRRIDNERALDLLLAPIAGGVGVRTVGKKGLRIDGGEFFGAGLESYVGQRVMVRHDPKDMGRVYCFDDDSGAFICEAVNLSRLGVDRMKATSAARAAQRDLIKERSAETRREANKITASKMAEDVLSLAKQDSASITALPRRSDTHRTDALQQAENATAEPQTPEADTVQQREIRETTTAEIKQFEIRRPTRPIDDHDRWMARYNALQADIAAGRKISEKDAAFIVAAETQAWFKARKSVLGSVS